MRRIIAGIVAIPLLATGQGGCHSNSGSHSNAQPTSAAPVLTPSPLPTPVAGAAVSVNQLPAPAADAAPKPLFPPDKCASVPYPTDTGLRVDLLSHRIVGTVDASCVYPPPQTVVTELEIWKVDGFNVNPIPGGHGERRNIPLIWPKFSTYTIGVPCVPGVYAFEFAVTWFDADGTSGAAGPPSVENGTVTKC